MITQLLATLVAIVVVPAADTAHATSFSASATTVSAAQGAATTRAVTPAPPLAGGSFVFDGGVTALARIGDDVYVGGGFTREQAPTGGGLILDAAGSGTPDASQFPQVAGTVLDAVADGAGGWFVGGDFTTVGGQSRSGLAHIHGDGTLDPAWNPSPNGTVDTLAVSGSTVYAGGDFTAVGGQARGRLAALDATTGHATSWNPGANDAVVDLAVSGSTIYAAGRFSSIGGEPRDSIAAIDGATGTATAWNPDPAGGYVFALAVSGSTVYAGGEFASIGGQQRDYLAALDATTANATAWDPSPSGAVQALAVSGSTVYVGGRFSTIGGQPRRNLAALDAATASATGWTPDPKQAVAAIAVSGSTVFVAGDFVSTTFDPISIGGETGRNRLAAIDTTTGKATAWSPDAGGSAFAVAVSGSKVYAGGDFAGAGPALATVSGLAKLDAAGDLDTNWDAGLGTAQVSALALSGQTLYVSGTFTTIGGQTRTGLAALDTTQPAATATAWNPGSNGAVSAIAVSGSTVYASGDFTSIGAVSQPRRYLAAVDASTANVTPWSAPDTSVLNNSVPPSNAAPVAIAASGSAIYAGGRFSWIGGQLRNGLAALDPASGAATAWNPSPSSATPINSAVNALAFSGSTVFAGGAFAAIGGQPRTALAALDASTGSATPWNPAASGPVSALATTSSTVYAGGGFTTIGGQSRKRLAALDIATGNARAWNPSPSGGLVDKYQTDYLTDPPKGSVASLVASASGAGTTVYAGGAFTSVNGAVTGPFAVLPDASAPLAAAAVPEATPDRTDARRVAMSDPPLARAPVDTTAPAATLVAGPQRLGDVIAVRVACTTEACTTTTAASARVPRSGRTAARTYRLRTAEHRIARGRGVTIRLALPVTARAAIRRVLRTRRRVAVRLQLAVVDAAGNRRTLTRHVAIER